MNIKNIGLTILIIAAALLIGNGIYHMFIDLLIDTDLSLLVKIGVIGIIVGIIILIIGLIIERIKDKRNENF
ncbi:MAG: hypothetical protein ACOC44_19360 [Promethearchaeia archaeon]